MLNTETEIQAPTITLPCTDGITWCDGDPVNHTSDDDHRHTGPEYALTGTYLADPGASGIATFGIAQWPGGEPHVVFQGTGLWADITLAQVDELIGDATVWLTELIATRRRLAIELNPGRTPFTESGEEQTATAAVALAHRAVDTALAHTGDRATTLRALHAYLGLAETEQA